MKPEEVLGLRLSNQGLAVPSAASPREVVSRLGALQGQDYVGALWSIGLRMQDPRQADIEKAIADRTIVRTWPMRGTLHYVAAEDVHWMVRLLAPRVAARNAGRLRKMGIDGERLALGRKLVLGMLDGTGMTRGEIYRRLASGGVPVSSGRGLQVLWWLAHEGVVCLGAYRGRQPTFVLLDQWVPESKRRRPDEPLSELARRYFASHGPASLKDFAWWSGLKVSEGAAAIRAVGAELEKVMAGDTEYWMSPESELPHAVEGAHLLPTFDEYVIAYKDRRAVIEPGFAMRKFGNLSALFGPKVVLQGKAIGTWKRALKRDQVRISLDLFKRLSREERETVEMAAGRYGKFLGKKVVAEGLAAAR